MADDKMGKVHRMINELTDMVKSEKDMAVFFSAMKVAGNAFEGVAYSYGSAANSINAVCYGISLMADTAQEAGADRAKFLEVMVQTIGRFDATHQAQKQVEAQESGQGGNA